MCRRDVPSASPVLAGTYNNSNNDNNNNNYTYRNSNYDNGPVASLACVLVEAGNIPAWQVRSGRELARPGPPGVTVFWGSIGAVCGKVRTHGAKLSSVPRWRSEKKQAGLARRRPAGPRASCYRPLLTKLGCCQLLEKFGYHDAASFSKTVRLAPAGAGWPCESKPSGHPP